MKDVQFTPDLPDMKIRTWCLETTPFELIALVQIQTWKSNLFQPIRVYQVLSIIYGVILQNRLSPERHSRIVFLSKNKILLSQTFPSNCYIIMLSFCSIYSLFAFSFRRLASIALYH